MKYSNKINIFKGFLFASTAFLFSACVKLPDGFLSPLVRYEEEPIVIQQGRVKVSSALNLDGSSKPAKVRVIHFYDKATGNIVDSLFNKKYTIKGWKALYDPKVDTTIELIQAKQFDMEVTPISINEVSGQVEANYTTIYLPLGNYEFDLEITNSASTQVYKKIGQIQLVSAPPFETNPTLGSPYVRMIKVGNEAQGTNLTAGVSVTITRTGDAPNKVTLKFLDKNNTPFNPLAGEIQRRPNTGTNPTPPFLQTLQDYSLKTELFSDRMEFTYGTVPFPLNSLGNGFNLYYRIPSQYFSHNNQTSYPDGQFSGNPRLQFRCYVPGAYQILFKYTEFVRK
jgi:hypothetical protein